MSLNNEPKIMLAALLKRRKTNLAAWIAESGISTYNELLKRCERLGVKPVSDEEFHKFVPHVVSNQAEGVVVLEPIHVTIDSPVGSRVDSVFTDVPSDPSAESGEPTGDTQRELRHRVGVSVGMKRKYTRKARVTPVS